MALIKTAHLNDLVRAATMQDAVLSNMDEETRLRNINLVLTITNPNTNGNWYESKALAVILFKFRNNGQDPIPAQSNELHQLILRSLMYPNLNLQLDVHYRGGPIIPYTRQPNRFKIAGKIPVEIQGEAISHILTGFVFQNAFQNDPFCANFLRCFTAVFLSYRRHNEAARSVRNKKLEKLHSSRLERTTMQQQVAAQGVNPKFGIIAHVDREILGKIAPGPGNQKQKIARARDEVTLVSGSACAQLNPTEQGMRAGLLARVAYAVRTDQVYQDSPDPAAKRRRIMEVSRETLDNMGDLTYPGATEEVNLRLVYNPAEAVKLELELLMQE